MSEGRLRQRVQRWRAQGRGVVQDGAGGEGGYWGQNGNQLFCSTRVEFVRHTISPLICWSGTQKKVPI